MTNQIEHYSIETNTDISIVRERIDKLFSNTNHVFKGKFVGLLNNDNFNGSTNYNVNITVKGKIIQDINKTIIEITISDNSPNYSTIINSFIIIFLAIILIIIASNKSTDFLHYLIPIIIFGFTWLTLISKKLILSYFKPKLKYSADFIAKEIKGKVKILDNKKLKL